MTREERSQYQAKGGNKKKQGDEMTSTQWFCLGKQRMLECKWRIPIQQRMLECKWRIPILKDKFQFCYCES